MLTLPEAGPNARGVDPSIVGFEWWYLQLVSPSYIGTFVLHTTPMLGGLASEPYISVWLRTADGTTIDTKIAAAQFSLQVQGDVWRLDVASEELSASGTVIASAPGLRLKENEVVSREDGLMTRWEVPIYAGEWLGSIVAAGQKFESRACAYQDHNWGVGRLGEYFAAWSWSALIASPVTHVSTTVLGRVPPQRFDYRQGVGLDTRNEREVVKTRSYIDGPDAAIYRRELFWRPSQSTGGFVETLSFN